MQGSRRPGLSPIRISTLLVTLFAAAACDDAGTAPNLDELDPEAASAALDGVVQDFFTDNPSAQTANGALGGFITALTALQPAAPPSIFSSLSERRSGGLGGAAGGRLVPFRSIGLQTTPFASSIPTALVGATCIWSFDPVSPNWADDTSRRGLCGTGNCIRFVLYPLGTDELPASDVESGFMDITDATAPGGGGGLAIDVAILSDFDAATRLDYGVTGSFSQTALNLTMSGFVSDGVSQLPLDLTSSGSGTSFSLGFTLTAGGFDTDFSMSSDESTGVSFLVSVVESANGNEIEIILDVGLDEAVASGSRITFNGSDVATLSGTLESITITALSGIGLTNQQVAGFGSLLDSVGGAFEEIGGLFLFAMANTGNPLNVLN